MKILLACERYGLVRDAFLEKGHTAVSCDVLPSVRPGPHIQGDVSGPLADFWDMIIAFPPCTDLAVSGAKHFEAKRLDGSQAAAIAFFMQFTTHPCPRIAIENPIGIMSTVYRKPTQIIQPYYFGDSYKKTTCLWLKGLPRLNATCLVDAGEFVITSGGRKLPKWYSNNKKMRDITFPGIAHAMADQWG